MSLMGTLAKVAIGIVVAKGVGSLMRKGAGGATGGSVGSDGRFGGPHSRGRSGGSASDLGSVMDDILKGSAGGAGGTSGGSGGTLGGGGSGQVGDPTGGLGGALGGILGGGAGGGGLGGILDQLGRAGGGGGGGLSQSGASGGLGGILGQIAGAGAAGGLGGLLGGLLGGGAQATVPASPGGGSFGDVLNQSLANGGEPAVAPDPAHEATAALLLSAMIQAAKADGRIDAAEQKKLTDSLGQASADERQFVRSELAKPIDIAGLCAQVPQGMGPQVYGMSLMAIDLDSPLEAKYLSDLAAGLGLDPQTVNAIHGQMGVRPLSS